MDKIQALNTLTHLANSALKGGIIKDIIEAGTIYTALIVLSKDVEQPVEQPVEVGEEIPTQPMKQQEAVVERVYDK